MQMSPKVPTLILLQGRQTVMARVWILHQNLGLGLGMYLSWMTTKVCTSLPPLHSPQVIILEEEIEKTRNVWHKQKSSCPLSLQSVGPFHTSALWDQLDGSTGPSKGCMVAYHKNVQQVREIYSSLAMEALIFPLDYSWISMFSAQIEQCEFEQVIFVFPQQDHKSPIPSDSVTRQVWNHFVVICALYSTWVYFT